MRTVLIVEDDPGVRKVLSAGLRNHDWHCRSAASPTEARVLAKTLPFDLILCDIMLPEINGIALVEELRELQPGAAVVFISGGPDLYLSQMIALHGDFPLLQKPFTFRTLLALASRLTTPARPPATCGVPG